VLSWRGQAAVDCQASGGWSGKRPTSGQFQTGPLTETTTYMLNCQGTHGGSIARVTVQVDSAAASGQVALRSTPGSVAVNGAAMLQWNAPNATQCAASGGWSGVKAASGSETVAGLAGDTTFTLTCDGPGGSSIAMIEVPVQRATLRWAPGHGASAPTSFRIYWGRQSGQPENQITISDPSVSEHSIDLPGPGTYYFILAALDASGNEIARSNEASKVLPA
jgi:hypothetical protein